ncbi:MAG: peptidylprolyl isomerase [Clostridia bacterium]|nr:peptidylprolyl isomerase [Clostridia bacterium]
MAKKNTAVKSDGQKGVTIALIAFLVLAVLIAAYSFIRYNTGVFQRATTAVSVGDQKLSAMDVRIIYKDTRASYLSQYGSILEMYGVDLANIDTQQCLFDSSMTWGQYFLNQGLNSAVNTATLMDLAAKDGREITDEIKASVKANVDGVKDAAEEAGISVKKYLAGVYGSHTTLSDVESAMTKQYFANEYYKDVNAGFKAEITDDAVNVYYNEHKDEFDAADYYTYSVPYKAEDDEDADPNALTQEQAKARADEILEKVTAENFDEVVKAYADENFETAFVENNPLSNYGVDVDWIKDGAEDGAKAVVPDESSHEFLVVLLVKRYLPEEPTVNVRHILIKTEEPATPAEDATDEEKANIEKANEELAKKNEEAKAKAEDILSKLKNATEDEFAKAATEYTEDTGSKSNGGLYENVVQGEMVAEFNDWCFDESRKPGDTDIVETDYGYHVMYFVSQGDVAYVATIKNTLTSDKYQEFINDAVDKSEYKINNLGISLM